MSRTINMMSKAHTVKGQGVLSAYEEQVSLVKNHLDDIYDVRINKLKFADIRHYHTINPEFFLTLPFAKIKSSSLKVRKFARISSMYSATSTLSLARIT